MAAGSEVIGEAAMATEIALSSPITDSESANNAIADHIGESEMVEMMSKLKLNPLAEEFFPSSYLYDRYQYQIVDNNFNNPLENGGFQGRRNNHNQRRKRFNGQAFRARREDSIRRTVYVSDVDRNITEEELADLFTSKCGQVVDCRICGDPHSRLHFAFVEFGDERSAREALNLSGTMMDLYPIRVLPSKTAILPVNPSYLPRSEDEREMCARTVYCTNIDKLISYGDIKFFFESCCGEVTRLRVLGDHEHSTRIAFVEFAMAESAIAALSCSGSFLGNQPMRVSPSKTPVRPRSPRAASQGLLAGA